MVKFTVKARLRQGTKSMDLTIPAKISEELGISGVLRPTEISIITGINKNAVSKYLKQLREKELIYLLNPDFHVGRLYDITEKGKYIIDFFD